MSHASVNPKTSRVVTRRRKLRNTHEEVRGAILTEQLSYLLDHSASCPPNCPECARLRCVEQVLLQPFRVKVFSAPA